MHVVDLRRKFLDLVNRHGREGRRAWVLALGHRRRTTKQYAPTRGKQHEAQTRARKLQRRVIDTLRTGKHLAPDRLRPPDRVMELYEGHELYMQDNFASTSDCQSVVTITRVAGVSQRSSEDAQTGTSETPLPPNVGCLAAVSSHMNLNDSAHIPHLSWAMGEHLRRGVVWTQQHAPPRLDCVHTVRSVKTWSC